MYSKCQFGVELLRKLSHQETQVEIGRWCYTLYNHTANPEEGLDEILISLGTMEDAPEFERSYEELEQIAKDLIVGKEVKLWPDEDPKEKEGSVGAMRTPKHLLPPSLLPGEGKVGTFRELSLLSKVGGNLTPNHVPQRAYMKLFDVKSKDGVAVMMEQPVPGLGGRHRKTRTYGKKPDVASTPRQNLARDLQDLRKIYQEDGLYREMLPSLREVAKKNKQKFPELFKKGGSYDQ
eukprot:g9146.t1